MKVSRFILFFVIIFVSFGVHSEEKESWVSIFNLISNPDQYKNKTVRVTGYLIQENQIGYRLYPYEIDATLNDINRGVLVVSLTDSGNQDFTDCADAFVNIVGTFVVVKDHFLQLVIHSVQEISIYDENAKFSKLSNFASCFTIIEA